MIIDFSFLLDTTLKLLAAVPTTLAVFVLSIALGGVIALGITWMRVSGVKAFELFARGFIYIFRGSPLMIQLFLIYYGLSQFPEIRQSLFWVVLKNPFGCAVLSLGLCTAAYEAEIFRGGLLSVPEREIEAARACGMSGFLLFRRIIAPIAMRQALPAYTTEIVLMVKSTSLASLVTVWEVTGTAQKIIAQTYRTLEVFLCAALIYLVLNYILVRLFAVLEHSLSPHLRRAPEAVAIIPPSGASLNG